MSFIQLVIINMSNIGYKTNDHKRGGGVVMSTEFSRDRRSLEPEDAFFLLRWSKAVYF